MMHVRNAALFTILCLSLAACRTTPDAEPKGQNLGEEAGAEASESPGEEAPRQLLQSEVTRELAPRVDDTTRAQLAADNRQFTFDMMAQIRSQSGANTFFSPHSISIALAMVYPGTSGETRSQLAEVLGFRLDEDVLHPAFNALDLALSTRKDVEAPRGGGDPPVLNIVNATWGQAGYPFADEYLDSIALNYGAGLQGVDFTANSETIREDINKWVEEKTNERIKDLLPQGSIDASTRLVLTNAIYFLAGWQTTFPENQTMEKPFRLLDGTEVDVPLMSVADKFHFYTDEKTQAVSMPYVGGELSFIALQPTTAAEFEQWEAAFDRQHFDTVVAALAPAQGKVDLPRFKIEGTYDMKALFSKMGWTNFDDLGAMVQGGKGGLKISDIFHKSFINLDEKGTEAAAATAVAMNESMPPRNKYELSFDRPFYYVIYDHPTDTILFFGRLLTPA